MGSYSNNIAKNKTNGRIFRPDNNSEQLFIFLNNRKNHLFKIGLDFYLNDKNTISFFSNQSLSHSIFEGGTDATFFNDSSFNQSQTFISDNENSSHQYNFDYKLDFEKDGHNLELEVDYNIY